MTQKDLNILDNLLIRTDDLPNILHLRAPEIGYQITDDDKKLLLDTYEKLDDILKEVAAFINVKFPGRQDFIYGWNKIDFDAKIGGIKIITNDREHIIREWKNGIFDLKSLLKTIRNEVILLVEEENNKIIKVPQPKDSNKSYRSWLEIASWIAGIIGTIIALYVLLS